MVFSAYTLGCKLNQLETEAITDSFSREGFTYSPFSQINRGTVKPGIILINTCTVTSMAEQKARRVIRKALRDHPEAVLIVTGCYAQMDRAAITGLEEKPSGRFFVVPGEKKDRLLDLPRFLGNGNKSFADKVSVGLALEKALTEPSTSFSNQNLVGDVSGVKAHRAFRFVPEKFSSHSRGFLKIQDGCDRSCAYCRVSLARGKSLSLAANEALSQLKALEQRGFAEVVLTGVNISQYSDCGMALPGLLEFLLRGTEKVRLRLSSLEPDALTDDLIRVFAESRIRPHFHLSLQSGSAEILAKMGRPYTLEDVEKALEKIRAVRQDPFLACDIIAGFPGETDAEYNKTRELCERTGFAWIHAFPFSPRPGTAAYALQDKVSEIDAVKRVEQLTELAVKGRMEYARRFEGKEVEAVVESTGLPSGKRKDLFDGRDDFFVPGVSENYLKLFINCLKEPIPSPGALVRCRIIRTSSLMSSSGSFDALAEKI